MPNSALPYQIFIVYAREDREPLEALRRKLAPLARGGQARVWYDGEITGGKTWDAEIKHHLDAADIVLLLISDDFFESDYIDNVELKKALGGHRTQEKVVAPVILYDCLWTVHPELASLQALPDEAKPVFQKRHWPEPSDAFYNVAQGILRILADPDTAARRARRLERQAREVAETANPARTGTENPKKQEVPAIEKPQKETPAPAGATRGAEDEAERRKYLHGMKRIPGGTFRMGSAENDKEALDNEKPAHDVRVADFYLAKYPTTVAQFKTFVDDTGYQTDAEKSDGSYRTDEKGEWVKQKGVNWRHDCEGRLRPETEYDHPVVHVSWNDARAYCDWLSKKTGQAFRLPTEAEWEYAAGNGAKHTRYSWGDGAPSGKKGGNVADETAKKKFPSWTIFEGYTDGFVFTAPVGSFDPNDFGLYDMTGNVWEWCEDWFHNSYKGAPTDGSAWLSSAGSSRVLRGGSWLSYPQGARVACRGSDSPDSRVFSAGFRLARTV